MPSSTKYTARTRRSSVMARVSAGSRRAKGSRSQSSVTPAAKAASLPAKQATQGQRVGSKHRDMRWQAPDGTIWASRFEYEVYDGLNSAGYNVRKTTEQDGIRYTHAVRNGICEVCGASDVVTARRYTPDLFVSSGSADSTAGYYVEAKGYLRGPQRSLLRSLRKARPDVDLRLIIQRDYKVGKSTLIGWATKYLKVKVHVWTKDEGLPSGW